MLSTPTMWRASVCSRMPRQRRSMVPGVPLVSFSSPRRRPRPDDPPYSTAAMWLSFRALSSRRWSPTDCSGPLTSTMPMSTTRARSPARSTTVSISSSSAGTTGTASSSVAMPPPRWRRYASTPMATTTISATPTGLPRPTRTAMRPHSTTSASPAAPSARPICSRRAITARAASIR